MSDGGGDQGSSGGIGGSGQRAAQGVGGGARSRTGTGGGEIVKRVSRERRTVVYTPAVFVTAQNKISLVRGK